MFWRRKQREQDLERELRSDLELEAEERQEAGASVQDAGYAARRAFGNTTIIREDTRATWGWGCIESTLQDLRYALRFLRKRGIRRLVAFPTQQEHRCRAQPGIWTPV
jgi:hypothetical protein